MKVALIQSACHSSKDRNLDHAVQQIKAAASQGADVVCLQELFATEYPCQSEDHTRFSLAEAIPGPSCEMLADVAKSQQVVVVGSFFERRSPGVYHNTAVVFETNGEMLGKYRKMHIPDDPLYYEKFYFTPGDLGFRSFATSKGNVGVCICWDQWFPEAARLTALHGAEVIFYPTAIGWLPDEKAEYGASQHSAWETMMRSHAIANGVFVAAANRVGHEGKLEFWGASFVADPNGNILARGSHDQPEIVTADCNLEAIDVVRTHWPFLRDRRIEAYGGLSKRMIDDES
jgi:N-carbamoylputrescine amidase